MDSQVESSDLDLSFHETREANAASASSWSCNTLDVSTQTISVFPITKGTGRTRSALGKHVAQPLNERTLLEIQRFHDMVDDLFCAVNVRLQEGLHRG
jgi:hypothetical protein